MDVVDRQDAGWGRIACGRQKAGNALEEARLSTGIVERCRRRHADIERQQLGQQSSALGQPVPGNFTEPG
jgi:hypothetical protein